MIDIPKLGKQVRKVLHKFAIEFVLKQNHSIKVQDLDKVLALADVRLPSVYVEFVTGECNGFEVEWRQGKDLIYNVAMLAVDQAVALMANFRANRYVPLSDIGDQTFPNVTDRDMAIQSNARLYWWLPLFYLPNGDCISMCVDSQSPEFGSILFDRHDWNDWGDGRNGFLLSSEFASFLTNWFRNCLQQPASLDWRDVITETGVDWQSKLFLADLRCTFRAVQ